MKVSVIIPTYNRPEGLKNAIKSVFNQTLTPNQVIIVDDASEINVRNSIKSFLEKTDVEVIYYKLKKNRGACAARNKGIELSKNEILMFLDDDDTWEPDKIKKQINILQKNNQIGMVYSGRKVVYDDSRENILYQIKAEKSGCLYPEIFYNNLIGCTSSVAVKKGIILEAGIFDEKLPAMQDFDLWIRICKLTEVESDKAFNVRYTIARNPKKQISGNPDNHMQATKVILSKYKRDLDKHGFRFKRRVTASRYKSIAKAVYSSSYWASLKWTLKSFLQYPEITTLTLFLPPKIRKSIQKIYC